jgi:hypothetical protein
MPQGHLLFIVAKLLEKLAHHVDIFVAAPKIARNVLLRIKRATRQMGLRYDNENQKSLQDLYTFWISSLLHTKISQKVAFAYQTCYQTDGSEV